MKSKKTGKIKWAEKQMENYKTSFIPWCMNPLSHSSTPKISASSLVRQSPLKAKEEMSHTLNLVPENHI